MKGMLVLVRAYGMRPFVGRVLSENQRGLRVARPDADLDVPDVPAAGIPWDDAFSPDPKLTKQLMAAADSGDGARLAELWGKARPLRYAE